MTRKTRTANGYTVTELLVASSAFLLALALSLGGWSYVLKGERRNSVQCELDMQVRMAIERLRSELRVSSVDKMVFHPAGPGPYTAISFPVPRDNDGDGLVDMQEDERFIDWADTVVYHIARGSPDRLLRTVFSPRDNTLTSEQRAEQLATVVADGHGSNAHNGQNSTTRVLFSNFFTWAIDPKNLTLDAYNPVIARRRVLFGSALIGPGDHTYRFAVQGRNPLSEGFKLGLDTLHVSPTTLDFEAEDQLLLAGGDNAARTFMPEGSWGGNHQLLFDTGAASEALPLTLQIPCDRWDERNFRTTGAVHERTQVVYDEAAGHYALELVGKGEAWNAADQTGSGETPDATVNFAGCGVRMLIRGDELDTLGFIRHDGRITGNSSFWIEGRPALYFRIPPKWSPHDPGLGPHLLYVAATIAEADPAGAATLDIRPGTLRHLNLQRQGSSQNVVGMVGAGTALLPIPISRTNSYVVSLRFPASYSPSYLPVWSNIVDSARIATVTIPAAAATDLSAASWSGKTGLATYPDLYALSRMVTAYPADGFFTSQIIDTTIDGPTFDQLAIDAVHPSGTTSSVQVRTGNQPDLSDASAWSAVPPQSSGGALTGLEGRYAQFRARLVSNALGDQTPQVSRVAIDWPGETRMVEVGGVITVGPDYGVFSVKVDEKPLVKGLRVALMIFKDVPGTPSRLTSSMSMEVEPRNTGK